MGDIYSVSAPRPQATRYGQGENETQIRYCHRRADTMTENGDNSQQVVAIPEASMTMIEVIQYHGYTVEEHLVQTEDGYLITIHRIPHGKNSSFMGARKPVIIQHGLFGCSACWVINTPDRNLAYILAEEGYDVWLTNVRGNDFGRNHVSIDTKDSKFWKFSWEHMAKYDLPAMIDFVLSKTGFKQLIYIGHSMGTNVGLATLASKPEYNEKVKAMVLMAPTATVGNIRSPLRFLVPYSDDADFWLTLLGQRNEFLPSRALMKLLSANMTDSPIKLLCSSILFLLSGFDVEQLNMLRLPVFLHFTPAGSSVQNVLHFAQMVKSKKFCQYDYGKIVNQRLYNQETPPEYNLKNITSPVALFWSVNDSLADPTDVADLASKLPNLALNYKVPYERFSHLDFMWAIDVRPLLYDKLVSTIKELWSE